MTKKSCNACLTDKKGSCLDACKSEFKEFSSLVGDSPATFKAFENYFTRLHGASPRLITRQASVGEGMELFQQLERKKQTGEEEIDVLFDLSQMSDAELKAEKKKLQNEYKKEVKMAMAEWKIKANYEKNKKEYIKQWLKKFKDDDWYHQANDQIRKFKILPELVRDIKQESSKPPTYLRKQCPSHTMKKNILFQTQDGVFAQTVLRLRRYLDSAKSKWDEVKRGNPLGFKAKDIYHFGEYWKLMNSINTSYHRLFDLFDDRFETLKVGMGDDRYYAGCSMILEGARDQIEDDVQFVTREMKISHDLEGRAIKKMKIDWGLNDDEPVEKVFKKLQMAVAEMVIRLKGEKG